MRSFQCYLCDVLPAVDMGNVNCSAVWLLVLFNFILEKETAHTLSFLDLFWLHPVDCSEWVTTWQMSWKSLSVFCFPIFLYRKYYIMSAPNCPLTRPCTPPLFCLTNTILSILLTTPPLAVNQYVVAQTHTFQTETLSFRMAQKLDREVCMCVFAGCVYSCHYRLHNKSCKGIRVCLYEVSPKMFSLFFKPKAWKGPLGGGIVIRD